jgi:hypothetical protein
MIVAALVVAISCFISCTSTQARLSADSLSLVHWVSSQIRILLNPVFLQFHFKCHTSTLFLSLIPLFRACESTVNRVISMGLQIHEGSHIPRTRVAVAALILQRFETDLDECRCHAHLLLGQLNVDILLS